MRKNERLLLDFTVRRRPPIFGFEWGGFRRKRLRETFDLDRVRRADQQQSARPFIFHALFTGNLSDAPIERRLFPTSDSFFLYPYRHRRPFKVSRINR